jgi:hypothetical protein
MSGPKFFVDSLPLRNVSKVHELDLASGYFNTLRRKLSGPLRAHSNLMNPRLHFNPQNLKIPRERLPAPEIRLICCH